MDGQLRLHSVSEDGETLLLGSSRDGQMNLYRHDLQSDETTKLTDYERAVAAGELAPDGDRIAYATNETDAYENLDVRRRRRRRRVEPRNLDIGDGGGGGPDRLGAGRRPTPRERQHRGSESQRDRRPEWGRLRRRRRDLVRRRRVRGVAEPLPGGRRPIRREPDARGRDGARNLRRRDGVGEARELDFPAGVANVTEGRLADDRLLAYRTTSSRRPELVAYDLASDATETVLDAEYGPFAPDDFVVEPETVSFVSDGVPETPARAVDHAPTRSSRSRDCCSTPAAAPRRLS